MLESTVTGGIPVGVVGLGLMGSSIVAALLRAGHPVKAIAPLPVDLETAAQRIQEQLLHCQKSGLLANPVDFYASQLVISDDYRQLQDCQLVLECVTEVTEVKEQVYQKIAAEVKQDAVLASNTSAIPISILQQYVPHPERFLGIHWAEPAYMTRFLEITCGEQTSPEQADWVFKLAHEWEKEPTLLRKDIRGFVTNRLMYAVYREAFHLVETEEARIEDVDKAFRYDAGSWMTLMGVFRRMDYLGLPDFLETFQAVFPKLCNSNEVPALMQKMIGMKARGTQDAQGLYAYTPAEAKEWDEAFAAFNQDIYKLAALYPAEVVRKKP
jgi:3-hydroxybutyryl-CoA dehydrogenase